MSGELNANTESGVVVYGIGLSGDLVLNVGTLTFVTYVSANLSSYKVLLTEQGVTGRYIGSVPAGTPAASPLNWYFYRQVGASPAESDPFVGSMSINWNGTAAVSDPSVIDNGVALISLDEAKEYLQVTGAADDAILSALINSASQWAQNYVGRTLLRRAYTEYYNGDDSLDLMLRNSPIASVTSVKIDSLRQWADDTAVDLSLNVITKKDVGILRAFNLLYGWTFGDSNIKVIYYAGYTAGSVGTMPHDIRLAIKRIVDHQFRTGYTNRKLDHSSEAVGGETTSFRELGIPKDAEGILAPYRQFFPSPQFSYAD